MATKAYTTGNFLLNLDGGPTTAWITSVGGGAVKTEVITEHAGPDELTFHHTAMLEFEPIDLSIALSASKPVLQWIQDSWGRKFARRNGSVVHGDFNFKSHIEQSFLRALIEEVGFPALNAEDTTPAYLSVKIRPEELTLKETSGDIQGVESQAVKAKMWNPSMFRLHIEGIDCSMVNKIEAISVKQHIAELHIGGSRYPEIEPTRIEFPNITISMAAAYAKDFIKWHDKFVLHGDKDTSNEKPGYIEFLDPTGANPIFTIDLNNVGIYKLTVDKSDANADQIKRVSVELYVDNMELKFGSGFE